jgi:hypothetical protein
MSKMERAEMIRRQFPSLRARRGEASPEGERVWKRTLDNDEIVLRVLKDILKVDQRKPDVKGPRPGLDYEEGMASFKRLMGQDFSVLPFAESLRILQRDMSLRTLSNKVGLDKMKVSKLLRGAEPTYEEMVKIARAFKKHPSYFLEYRSAYILAHLHERLEMAPESSIVFYRRMVAESDG